MVINNDSYVIINNNLVVRGGAEWLAYEIQIESI